MKHARPVVHTMNQHALGLGGHSCIGAAHIISQQLKIEKRIPLQQHFSPSLMDFRPLKARLIKCHECKVGRENEILFALFRKKTFNIYLSFFCFQLLGDLME